MFLETLEIVNFKNHSDLKLNFEKRINIFIGKNGAGKTNVLDAIYYLSVFRSHIHSQDTQNIKNGNIFFRLYGKYHQDYEVLIKYVYRNKSIEINKTKVIKHSEKFGHIPLVLSSPADIFVLFGGSDERRKLIDYTISSFDSGYLANVTAYNRYLDQRNGHLKKSEHIDAKLIDFYNSHLVRLGEIIFKTRKLVLEEFSKRVQYWYRMIAQTDDNIYTSYYSQLLDKAMNQLLKENFEKDKVLKRSTVGIHRDDLKIKMTGQDLKKVGSQGQQKSILYALRLAQAELISHKTKSKIIFLLDDFSDKLDDDRQRHLLARIESIDFISQWFITDTDDTNFNKNDQYAIFRTCFKA